MRTPHVPDLVDFDICVYGATASGLLAAVSAKRQGCTVALVEPGRWLGGMVGGGLRIATDCEYPVHVGGMTRELLLHERTFGVWDPDRGQADLRRMWGDLVDRHGIPVLFERRLQGVEMEGRRIERLVLDEAPPGPDGVPAVAAERTAVQAVRARVFIDASYEGDLMAAAGVPYTTGRESSATYGESLAGVRNVRRFPGIDPFRAPGNPGGGLLSPIPSDPLGAEGSASRFMIPFNFRYVRALQCSGDGVAAPPPQQVSADHVELVRRVHVAGSLGACPGNFRRTSMLDGSIPGLQADYPDGDWAVRSTIWRTLLEHDRLVSQVTGVKLCLSPDLYPDTGGMPHQLYIRMARRMIGAYVTTQADVALQTAITDPIGLAYYNVDVYPCRMVVLEDGTLATEGETWELVSPGPYPISYRALTPEKEACSNLLVPVCVSASHVACASIRMEPTFMIMGESAGVAAAQAIAQDCAVQEIDAGQLRAALLQRGQILAWDGRGYGSVWFNRPFASWWEKHPEEYQRLPRPQEPHR